MEFSLDNIKKTFEDLKHAGFFRRLFGWGEIKNRLIDANGELQRLLALLDELRKENDKVLNLLEIEKASGKNLQSNQQQLVTDCQLLKQAQTHLSRQLEDSQKEIATLKESNNSYLRRGTELSNELAAARQRLEQSDATLQQLRTQIIQLQKDDEVRKAELAKSMASLTRITEKVHHDREEEIQERNRKEIERIRNLKATWVNHEENVRNRIKTICSQYTIEYVEKVPFKGKPDNTLRINDEFIIFDAKSPANDDLTNFPSYIKSQVEGGKYVREDDVRKEMFLVVPTNTLDSLEQFTYRLSDYTVYVISIDALEPVILTLQRIEDYEFAEQLSPEERENISRVIGKFVHLSKRRIQIDGFFAKQFFELVYRSEADLPKEFMDKVIEFEKSEKLNPPLERRAKQINVRDLKSDSERLESEANQRGIITQDSLLSKELNKLPLYSTEPAKPKDKDQGELFDKKE
ncbi:MAG: hypothetical protein JST14_16605 [Bacteroidetes bacterium]|nr:hypothetical protein [Bacteroidota bacterium]